MSVAKIVPKALREIRRYQVYRLERAPKQGLLRRLRRVLRHTLRG